MKQSRVKHARNRHYSSNMKSMIKLILGYIKKGESDKAVQVLPKVVKSIDIAAKKNLIHKNNAAHKKSRVQKALNSVSTKSKPKTKVEQLENVEKTEDKTEEAK